MTQPNRWLHLRHPDGFSDEMFAMFESHCRIWRAYAEAVLAEWGTIEPTHAETPRYVFFDPIREDDGKTVTLPVGGHYTLASRVTLENAGSHLLSDFFPIRFKLGLEEGLTETTNRAIGPGTNWRRVMKPEPK